MQTVETVHAPVAADDGSRRCPVTWQFRKKTKWAVQVEVLKCNTSFGHPGKVHTAFDGRSMTIPSLLDMRMTTFAAALLGLISLMQFAAFFLRDNNEAFGYGLATLVATAYCIHVLGKQKKFHAAAARQMAEAEAQTAAPPEPKPAEATT